MELPWLEKHRPKSLDDVVGNSETISILKAFALSGNVPNLLFAGPAGIGKTSSIMCLVSQLLGKKVKKAVLELNASDDRGIETVRNRIKLFAQTKVALPPNRHKIVILDEADNITPAAQHALRRTMEIYNDSTRFLLSCNISSKIIEAIQSRCVVLRFGKLDDSAVLQRMLRVLELENQKSVTKDGLDAVLFLADGDLRNAINSLQATISGFHNLTAENVYKICDVPHPFILKDILDHCVKGDLQPALDLMNGLIEKGYMANDVISSLFRSSKTVECSPELQLEFIRRIGFIHMRVLAGNGSKLQLNGLIASLCRIANSDN